VKLQFIPAWEYDSTKDSKRVLGYPNEGEKLIPSLVQVYQYTLNEEGGEWHKLRGKKWRACPAPALFCDIPRIEILKFRKPTKEKIAGLDTRTAMEYVKRDKELQDKLTEFVKSELTKQFYSEE